PSRPELGPDEPKGIAATAASPASTLSADAPHPGPFREAPRRTLPFTLSGRYVAERELGQGGMGCVYLARDTRMQRSVAIKLLPSATTTEKQLRRLEQEALVVGSLGHPNVLAVHDIANDGGQPFIVEEFLDGATLRQLLATQKLSLE